MNNKKNWIVYTLTSLSVSIFIFSIIYYKQIKNSISEIIDYVFSNDIETELKKMPYESQVIFRSFLRDIEKMGYKIIITNGVRTINKQRQLNQENPQNAKAGFSHHNYGTGIDINVIYKNNWLRKSSSKEDWEKTGIPKFAKTKYNLRWGGDFVGYHDPVHFDLENIYPIKKLYANAIKKFGSIDKIEGNKLDLSKLV